MNLENHAYHSELKAKLKAQWQTEENYAFKGWDFSHLDGRWKEEALPWDYRELLIALLKSTDTLLDMGTGGGELLLSLGHSPELTSVTEAYPPNVELCKKTLAPMGITVKEADGGQSLPFNASSFDVVANRHEDFNPSEVSRILNPGGLFITQQVGGKNDEELSLRLLPDFVPPFPEHTLEKNKMALEQAGFQILKSEEAFTPLRFYDVGALVYFAKIIEWEFPGFSVESAFEQLWDCRKEIAKNGFVQGTEHRFLLIGRKP